MKPISDDIARLISRIEDSPRKWAPISGPHLDIKFSEREIDALVKALQKAAALEGSVAVPVEVREKNGAIDEIVIKRGNIHIEQMDSSRWFMGVDASDGSYWQFWFGALKGKAHVGFRHTEHSTAEAEQARRDAIPRHERVTAAD
jgi:hypothetical protein